MHCAWILAGALSLTACAGNAAQPSQKPANEKPATPVDPLAAASPSDGDAARELASGDTGSSAADRRLPIVHGQSIAFATALGSLEAACTGSTVGGTFTNGECICPSGRGTFGYSPRESVVTARAGCTERVVRDRSVSFEALASSGTAASLESSWAYVGPLDVRVGIGTETERTAVARAVASAAGAAALASSRRVGGPRQVGLLYKEIPSIEYTPRAISHLIVGRPSPEDLGAMIGGVLSGPRPSDPQGSAQFDVLSRISFDVGFVEPEPDKVSAALGIFGAGSPPAVLGTPSARLPGEDANGPSARRALAMAYDSPDVRNSFDASVTSRFTGYYLIGDSCLEGACRLFGRAASFMLDGALHSATVDRMYSRGTVVWEVIWVQREGRLVGFVALTPNRGAGLFAVASESVTSTNVELRLRAYDRKWNDLGAHSYALDLDNALWRGLADANTFKAGVTPKASAMVICDVGFAGFWEEPKLRSHILFGPNQATFADGKRLSGGSLFGWTPNPVGTSHDYLTGFGVSDWEFVVAADRRFAQLPGKHFVDVGEAAIATFEGLSRAAGADAPSALNIIPMNFQRCSDTRLWRSARQVDGELGVARVVNASFRFAFEEVGSCMYGTDSVVDATAGDLLWVVAAGNDLNKVHFKDAGCPMRSVRGKSNGLVVAALTGAGGINTLTNYGADFADIAANGVRETDGGAVGATSYAAPRVSATAVAISERYPNLSPWEVRASILFGARERDDLKTVVRAAGELAPYNAFRVAGYVDAAKSARGLRGPLNPSEDRALLASILREGASSAGLRDVFGRDPNARVELLLGERKVIGD